MYVLEKIAERVKFLLASGWRVSMELERLAGRCRVRKRTLLGRPGLGSGRLPVLIAMDIKCSSNIA